MSFSSPLVGTGAREWPSQHLVSNWPTFNVRQALQMSKLFVAQQLMMLQMPQLMYHQQTMANNGANKTF